MISLCTQRGRGNRRTKKLKVGRKKIQRKSKKHCKINPFYVYVLPGAVPNLNLLLGTSLPISSNLGSVKWGKEKCVSASTAIREPLSLKAGTEDREPAS